VTPGFASDKTSSSAWAANLLAARIRPMVSSSYLSPPTCCAGAGRPTYSGLAMLPGTALCLEIVPGTSVLSAAFGMVRV